MSLIVALPPRSSVTFVFGSLLIVAHLEAVQMRLNPLQHLRSIMPLQRDQSPSLAPRNSSTESQRFLSGLKVGEVFSLTHRRSIRTFALQQKSFYPPVAVNGKFVVRVDRQNLLPSFSLIVACLSRCEAGCILLPRGDPDMDLILTHLLVSR